jgi:hypothetical protein
MINKHITISIFLTFFPAILCAVSCYQGQETIRLYEIKEIVLTAANTYENPYAEVDCWLELEGPGFSKKIYGFWNGGNEFVFRIAATSPGSWSWRSFSNVDDKGLNGRKGSFKAVTWHENELMDNPNRRGFLRASPNGRALEYADGTPFFMLGDTWWAASTWRYPLKGVVPDETYIPAEGISFEEAVHFRKRQGYNTIAMIAAFPNWKADNYPPRYIDANSVGVRQAWSKNGTNTAKDMHDEKGNVPFLKWDESDIIADFNRLNPEYFKSLDKKIQYLHQAGFVTFLETVRRDHGPSWKHYFDWPGSFSKYVQYIIARYGAYNIIFSGIHLDWILETFSLTSDEFNQALTYHYEKYGGLPYGQPHTILIEGSTFREFGHGDEAPWLTMHSVGNAPRHHGFYPMLEEIFSLEPPYPAANLEPYYPGWNNPTHNNIAGETPEPDSERDHYFARAQMYGSVLSGGLAGHLYGTGAYGGNTTGEPKNEGDYPYIWEALVYDSGSQFPFLARFILSEGKAYQDCAPRRDLLKPHKAEGSRDDGLDGWSFMLLAANKELAFLYFENKSEAPLVTGLMPGTTYTLEWFDPVTGEWLPDPVSQTSDKEGNILTGNFPYSGKVSDRDWCLKIKADP